MGLLLFHADVLNCQSYVEGEIGVEFIRNTREIHENSKNSKNKHFKVTLLTDWLFYPIWPKL